MDLHKLITDAMAKGTEASGKAPTSSEEALVLLLVECMRHWDAGKEPIASTFDALVVFLANKADPFYEGKGYAEKSMMTLLAHQVKKARDHARDKAREEIERTA